MRRLQIATLLLALAAPAHAGLAPGAPDLAFGAYQRGYYQTAFAEAMKRIDKDLHDAAAMTLVAELEAQGLGVKQSMSEALRWYKLAADQGDGNAQFALALAKLAGKDGPRDVRARALLQKAAAQDHAGAWLQLGVLALEGNGVASDFPQRGRRFPPRGGVERRGSRLFAGLLYREGRGVEKDTQQAGYWLRKSAEGGFSGGAGRIWHHAVQRRRRSRG